MRAWLLLAVLTAGCGGAGSSGAPAGDRPETSSVSTTKATVVPHESLQALLPDLAGWTRGEPRGETDRSESVSRVTVNYDKGESTISIEFMDSSRNEQMLAPLRGILASPAPSPGTTVGTSTIGGFPAAEEWTAEAKNGSIHVLVADRFMVAVTGSTVPDLATIRAALDAIDLQKLAALK
jgi:hypothetical protein